MGKSWLLYMILHLIFSVCYFFILFVVGNKIKKTIRTICLNQVSFGSIGGRKRRNVFSFQDIHKYIQFSAYNSFLIFIGASLVAFKMINSSRVILHLWGTPILLHLTYKDVYLPWRILTHQTDFCNVWGESFIIKDVDFYVRKPDMIPRRSLCVKRQILIPRILQITTPIQRSDFSII